MKIIISEIQYNFIVEQWWNNPEHPEWKKYAPTDYEKRELKKATTTLNNLDPHTLLTITQIGTAFIPYVGPFISAGIGLADAGLYYKEGDKQSAAVVASLSVLPFVGSIVSKIPGVKQLGAKGMAKLASSLKSGQKLNATEQQIAKAISENQKLVREELNTVSKKITPLVDKISKFKPDYIQRYGQESYEKLIRDFISGSIDEKVLFKTLESGKKAAPKSTSFLSKFGIKLTKNEVSQIHQITSLVKGLPKVLTKGILDSLNPVIQVETKEGLKNISLKFITSKQAVKMWGEKFATSYGGALGNKVYFIVDNIKKMSRADLDQLFYHEITHIKDPSLVSTKLEKLYNSNVTRYSPEYYSKSYYFHPRELVANTSKILTGMSTNTSKVMKQLGKQRTLQALDDLINWSKGIRKEFTEDMTKLLGYNEPFVKNHFDSLTKSPKDYKNLVTKVAQQANYLKSQVKIALQ